MTRPPRSTGPSMRTSRPCAPSCAKWTRTLTRSPRTGAWAIRCERTCRDPRPASLMSRRSRIFLGVVVVYIAAVVFLLYRVSVDIDPRYRESAEDSLVDTANLLATLLERQVYSGVIQTEELERTLQQLEKRPLNARIYNVDKTRVD